MQKLLPAVALIVLFELRGQELHEIKSEQV